MNIAICDDQQHFRTAIKQNLKKYNELYYPDEEWTVTEFSNGDVLIAEDEKRDLYFLDLEMPAKDGIEVAAGLRKKWKECNIFIMTSHIERMKEGYRVNAFRFMTKPVQYDEMREGLDALRKSQAAYESVTLYSYGTPYNVLHRDIRYLCRESGDTVLYVKDMKFRSEKSLEDWEAELGEEMFFRCHKSYIVNLRYVEDVTDKAFLEDGEIIPVSRRKKTAFNEKVKEYDLTYGG